MPKFMDDTYKWLYRQALPGTHLAGDVPPPTQYITYGREYYGDGISVFADRGLAMMNRGITNSSSVLVVGCGLGFLMEYLIDAGVETYGIDTGSHLVDAAADIRVDLLPLIADDWIGSGTEKASLQALGVSGQAKFNYIVDEDAAPMHDDAELAVFYAGLEERLQGNNDARIIHIVSTGAAGDTSVNWKSLADWKATAPSHTWVDARTGDVL